MTKTWEQTLLPCICDPSHHTDMLRMSQNRNYLLSLSTGSTEITIRKLVVSKIYLVSEFTMLSRNFQANQISLIHYTHSFLTPHAIRQLAKSHYSVFCFKDQRGDIIVPTYKQHPGLTFPS